MMFNKQKPLWSDQRRVVVTGLGAVSALGNNLSENWQGILSGISKSDKISHFDASSFPHSIGYQVQDFKFAGDLVTKKERDLLSRAAMYGCNAAFEALHAAGLPSSRGERRAVILGGGLGTPDFDWLSRTAYRGVFAREAYRDAMKQFPYMLGQVMNRVIGANQAAATIHTACASSAQAIGEAYQSILFDEADVVLTGGADTMLEPLQITVFASLGASSRRNDDPATACRPFDKDRDGLVVGDGACMMVLEELNHALERNAPIFAEITGYGITNSAYRLTDLHPDGLGIAEAMAMALSDAAISPKQISYVNAHGTSTLNNDQIEAAAIARVFSQEHPNVLVNSTKSLTGHMIAAAGAMECGICIKALQEQILPPTVNLFEQDPNCSVALAPIKATPMPMDYVMSNSIGFGGSNAALVIKRYH